MTALSKTFTVTRKEVINAINTEPLGATMVYATTAPGKKTCKVCAVGAVLRGLAVIRKGANGLLALSKDEFNDVASTAADASDYLSALSGAYETRKSVGLSNKKIRVELVDVINDTFPARIKVSYTLGQAVSL